MNGLAKFLVESILGKAVDSKDKFESDRFSSLDELIDEMGLPGGAGVGLSLPGGYINGAPKADDVAKVSKKLKNKGMSGYEEVDEVTNSKNHKGETEAERDFVQHHKSSMYAPDMGYGAEKDTYDFDDGDKTPGHQTDTEDDIDKGYEPVKEVDDNIPGGLAKGKTLIDLAKRWDPKGYYDPKQFVKEYIAKKLKEGIKVEMEHTTDIRIAAEIAMDHLWEDIRYYDKLQEQCLLEYSGADAFYNDGNTVTGYQWNADWDDYNNAKYYTQDLPGWSHYHEKPSEHELKRLKNQAKLPVDNHDDSVHKYNRTLKYGYKLPSDFIKGDGKNTSGTTDDYPNKYNNDVNTDERINMDPNIHIDGEAIKDDERHIPKSVKLYKSVNEGIKELEKERDKLFLQALKMMPNSPAQMKVRYELDKILAQIKNLKKESINESLLMEGGAAGHLAHPFDDADLKFSDMKEMIHRGLVGGLDKEAPVSEKLDGQNIAFSIKNGKVVFARNKGHVKNSAENALDTDGVAKMFAGRGNVEKAFTSAANDLQSAVSKLSPKEVQKMFGNGSKFMSLEIILPDTENVIPYGKSVLIFHNTIQYDKDGNEVGRSGEDASTLANSIQKAGASQQKTFGIEGPKVIAFSDADQKEYEKKSKDYQSKLSQVAKSYGLNDNSKLEDYRRKWWIKEIETQSKKAGIKLSNSEKAGLVKRWADGDKGFGAKNISDDNAKNWFKQFETTQLIPSQKQMIKPIENIFLNVGANTIKRVTNFLASNNPEAGNKLKSETLKSIKAIKDSKDTDKIAKLQTELERLNSIGMDKIVPSEGLVFQYNGKPYKFTGAFAPVNQINGTFKFDRGGTKKEEEKGKSKTIAIFSGRFQPFHQGHYSIYKHLVEKFGKDNVYIATSDKTEPNKSPFSFNDKKNIITTMFDVPTKNIVKVKNPYAPTEILDSMPENTHYVTAVSQKDADRLQKGGKYFKDYNKTTEKSRKGYKEEGYYIIAPEMQVNVNGKNISGTQLRAVFGSSKLSDKQKEKIFKQIYPKFDKTIFNKIVTTTKKSEKAGVEKDIEKQTKLANPKKKEKINKILASKIKNPDTGRMINVKTALSYDDSKAVKKSAKNLVKRAIS